MGGMPRRPYGSGSLTVRRDAAGREAWYGQWWAGGRRITRKVGSKRERGGRRGLTRAGAERELQRLIDRDRRAVAQERVTVQQAGELLLEHLESLGRKRSTVGEYRSYLRVHLAPFFAQRTLDKVSPHDVEAFMALKRREGKATKSILNYVGLLHSIFNFAERRGLANLNPVKLVEKPERPGATPDIRFLDQAELEALLKAVPEDVRGPTERAIYLAAAMAGLRQGELIALRWRDVDWTAARIRVRQNLCAGSSGRRSPAGPVGRYRWPTGWPPSSSTTSDEAHISAMTISSLAIPRPGTRSIARGCSSGSSARLSTPVSVTSASTTSGTPSGPAWLRQVSRFAPFRSGWDTATSRPP
jgi:site-specific recombinase XerC